MEGKAEALRLLSKERSIPVQSIAFVGDHLNDCAAMRLSGCPIAYDPKSDDVRKLARQVIAKGKLDSLLDLFPSRQALS
jgi:phosphoserine phosphatase